MNLDVEFIAEVLGAVVPAIPTTLKIAFFALLLSLPLGILMAIIVNKKIKVLSQISLVYISMIRGTPLLLQIYFIYNLVPYLLAEYFKSIGSDINVYQWNHSIYAVIALSLSTTVSIEEAVRAGLNSVDKGQFEGALSVGLNEISAFIRIIFPQAMTVAMPVIGNVVVTLMKSTSLAFMMSVVDIMGAAKILGGKKLRYFEAYIAVFLVYIVIVFIVERIVKLIEWQVGKYRKGVKKA